jgi:hypothetical protein
MSSIRRQISLRLNGTLSRSPVTEEGNRRSSLNALRHGLLAAHTVNALESQENLDVILEDLRALTAFLAIARRDLNPKIKR